MSQSNRREEWISSMIKVVGWARHLKTTQDLPWIVSKVQEQVVLEEEAFQAYWRTAPGVKPADHHHLDHHPRCAIERYEEEYVDVDRVRRPTCDCYDRERDDRDRWIEGQIDKEEGKG